MMQATNLVSSDLSHIATSQAMLVDPALGILQLNIEGLSATKHNIVIFLVDHTTYVDVDTASPFNIGESLSLCNTSRMW